MNSLDHIADLKAEIKLNGKTYTLSAPTVRIYAQIIRRLRVERLLASSEACEQKGIDPNGARDYWRRVASSEITMEEVRDASNRPDMCAWIAFKLAEPNHPNIQLEEFERASLAEVKSWDKVIAYLFTIQFSGRQEKQEEDTGRPFKSETGETRSPQSSPTSTSVELMES